MINPQGITKALFIFTRTGQAPRALWQQGENND
jgi:hypothetical protein